MPRDFTKQLYAIRRKGVLDDIKWCLRGLDVEQLNKIHLLIMKVRHEANKATKKRAPGHEAE